MAGNEHRHDIKIPLGVLIAIAAILIGTISAVALFRISGTEPVAQVPHPEHVVAMRQLRFTDGDQGTVMVHEVKDGKPDELIHVIQAAEGGFIRGVLRSLARARRAAGISDEAPFVLIEQANGILLLEDPMTAQRIDLQAFGPSNIESFKALLTEPHAPQ